jgi:hypothetical protein
MCLFFAYIYRIRQCRKVDKQNPSVLGGLVEPMKALYSGALVTATRKDERTRHRRPI